MGRLRSLKVSLKLPAVAIEGLWEPDERERDASWELYVELITRVAAVELQSDEGLLREALLSLHSLFGITRDILKRYGPDLARPKASGDLSLGHIAVAVLNGALRPFLARWHPVLSAYEEKNVSGLARWEHEKHWEHSASFRAALAATRNALADYADLLARAADVPSLRWADG